MIFYSMAVKLRPHHVEKLIELKKKGPLYRVFFSGAVRTLYGAETYQDFQGAAQRIKEGEDISLTREIGELCEHCPYQKACLAEDYGLQENMPWLFKMMGGTLDNTRSLDDKAMTALKLEEGKTYRLDDLLRR